MFSAFMIVVVLVVIIVAIVKFDIHPFLALFVGALSYGVIVGMPAPVILQSITDGFGGVVGKIGLVILLGVTIGMFLEKTGGALVIAQRLLQWIGEKSVMLAMMVTGWFMSIPVFADSAFVIMNTVNKSLSLKGRLPFVGTTIALSLGVTASHSLVPPTPGPIAAAGFLKADLGMVIVLGVVVSLLALIPCFFFAKYYASGFPLVPEVRAVQDETKVTGFPSLTKSFLPLIVPLLLILMGSVAAYPTHPFGTGAVYSSMIFLGDPVIAMLLGVFLCFLLPTKFDRRILSSTGWIGEALIAAAPIIFITGAGGVFGKMLQNSGVIAVVTSSVNTAGWGLLLPYLMALALKTAQGSSTVAMITTASIVSEMLPALGFEGELARVLATLAVGAGALGISHANDSFFWVMTQMTGMNVKVGNQTHSLGTLLLGLTAITIIHLLAAFLL